MIIRQLQRSTKDRNIDTVYPFPILIVVIIIAFIVGSITNSIIF